MKIKFSKVQIFNLRTHYEVIKNLPMGLGYSFKEWILSYKDFPIILKSMANKPYKEV